jgi:hypothetical protein
MSDLVTRLQAASHDERLSTGKLYADAADEIERLRDWQRRAIARAQWHNAQLRQRCGEGYSEGVRCGYRPYLLNSGRRCTHCPVYEQIDFDDLMEEATR